MNLPHVLLLRRPHPPRDGVTLVEVLVTILILAFGLTGLVGLQAKVQAAHSESYQRAQAILLVQDMANRISANRASAATYVTAGPLGTGDNQPASCAGLVGVPKDQCQWSHAIRGAAERQGTALIGAMVAGRGCVEQIGSDPAVYRVTIVWQGLTELTQPASACGEGLYPHETLRRAMSRLVTVADLAG
jgi:type IV pilus assembly protein PilV